MKKFTFGKFLTLLCMAIFIVCMVYVSIGIFNDSAIAVAMITATGSLAITCVVAYQNKARQENIEKLNSVAYKEMIENRLYFNREMLKMKNEFQATDDDIAEIDAQSDADELMDNARDRIINENEEEITDCHAKIEKVEVV